jgi:4-hydroxy-tetrahydrodipicolinate reductase
MGKIIEELALEKGHEITGICDPHQNKVFDLNKLEKAEAAIDFTWADSVVENLYRALEARVPVITGTTGWYDKFPAVREAFLQKGGSLFYASNFSLGVHIIFHLNRILARIMAPYKDFSPEISEIHHKKKKDAPSGTAISLVNDILKENPRFKDYLALPKEVRKTIPNEEIPVYYSRLDDVVGYHKISYISPIEKLTVQHEAFSRKGFALGTLLATEWLSGKTGVFTMDDLLNF